MLNQAAANNIIAKLDAARETDRSASKHVWNWASEMAHPCLRFLVLARTQWSKRKLPTVELEYRFEDGNLAEWYWREEIQKVGVKITKAATSFDWEAYQISGKIDGMAEVEREDWPWECKLISPNLWRYTDTIENMKLCHSYWVRRMVFQLNIYLLMANKAAGLLFIKTQGLRPRLHCLDLDYVMGEEAVSKAKAVNEHVKAGTLPERMPFDASLCLRCDFDHVCLPIKNITDTLGALPPETAAEIRAMKDLEEPTDEHDRLEKKLIGDKKKPGLLYGKQGIVDEFIVSSKTAKSTWYDVPSEMKAPFKVETEYFKTSIDLITD